MEYQYFWKHPLQNEKFLATIDGIQKSASYHLSQVLQDLEYSLLQEYDDLFLAKRNYGEQSLQLIG